LRRRFGRCGSRSTFCGELPPKKLSFCAVDRMIFVGLYRLFPKICDALGDRQAGHPCPLASCRVQILLALEVGDAAVVGRLFR